MERFQLKNIIILILLLMNGFLLASVVQRRSAEQDAFRRTAEQLVALFEDEATVKRLSRRNGEIWLLPENDDYSPIDGTYATIMGKVTAVVRWY